MIKDVWCNVVVPIIVAVEVKDDKENAFWKVEERFYKGDLDINEKVFSSYNEGNTVIEWQEHDEIVEP